MLLSLDRLCLCDLVVGVILLEIKTVRIVEYIKFRFVVSLAKQAARQLFQFIAEQIDGSCSSGNRNKENQY